MCHAHSSHTLPLTISPYLHPPTHSVRAWTTPAHCSHGVRRRRTRCLRWARRGSAHCCAAAAAATSARLLVRPMPRHADGCIKCAIRQASCSLAARVREAAMLQRRGPAPCSMLQRRGPAPCSMLQRHVDASLACAWQRNTDAIARGVASVRGMCNAGWARRGVTRQARDTPGPHLHLVGCTSSAALAAASRYSWY